jgi:hypothetical protein
MNRREGGGVSSGAADQIPTPGESPDRKASCVNLPPSTLVRAEEVIE